MSIDLSLDRIRDLVSHLTPYTRPTCHIAGTNGKGSVAAILSSIFAAAGYTVGRFNSPHLIQVHDCISLNNATIDRKTYDTTYAHVVRVNAEYGCGASSFELLTATVLQIFEQAQVDVAVLEVGMGGRLDATNVIPDDCVLASALTTVDLDHQAFLGDTISKIAKEKAAIARKDRPFVLGPQYHGEVELVARVVVEEVGGRFIIAPSAFPEDTESTTQSTGPAADPCPQTLRIRLSSFDQPLDVDLPLQGDHQRDNLGTAIAVLDALLSDHRNTPIRTDSFTQNTLRSGIRNVSWPGRLSWHCVPIHDKSLTVLADGAHNPASARTLAAYITNFISGRALSSLRTASAFPFACHVTYVLALSHSPPKTPEQTLEPLLRLAFGAKVQQHLDLTISVAALRFTPPVGMPWVKSVTPSDIRNAATSISPSVQLWTDHNDEALGPDEVAKALQWAANAHQGRRGDELVVVAGSLYLIADLYRLM
jgi:folylpolyglutamate synthase/dihydrofolate synthase